MATVVVRMTSLPACTLLTWRDRGCEDKFPGDTVAMAVPPRLDRVQIAGANPRPHLMVEARPRECDGATDKRRVAGLVRVGEGERCCETTASDSLKLRVRTQTCEGVLLSETEE